MRFGSLFAGVGGLDLGLEWAGMECAWQVEIDDHFRRVLVKHWPDMPIYKDVRDVGRNNLESVDLIAGGFPCQPHSVAGKRKGAADNRDLWPEFIRIIRETRPRYVLGENVPGIVTTYLDTVLSDLEGEGYTCWTFNIPAVAFDALHRRERIFIVAHTEGRQDDERRSRNVEEASASRKSIYSAVGHGSEVVSDTNFQHDNRAGYGAGSVRRERSRQAKISGGLAPDTTSKRLERKESEGIDRGKPGLSTECSWWTTEPDVGRVAHGIPSRVDRLRGLGNAVVPQVAEWIGRNIMRHEELTK